MIIGIIGFGNMGQALAEGLLAARAVQPGSIHASDMRQDSLESSCARLGVVPGTNREVAKASDLVILAVKPGQIAGVIQEIEADLQGKPVISIAAGIPYAQLKDMLPENARGLCCLPNTPVAIGKGILICEETHGLTAEDMALFTGLFEPVALIVFLEAAQISPASTIASCGPAFAAMFLEALGDAGVKYGVRRDTAYRLAARMLEGTAALHLKTGQHPGQMKDNVCSPGGTTIRGVSALEQNGFRHAVISAIDAVDAVKKG